MSDAKRSKREARPAAPKRKRAATKANHLDPPADARAPYAGGADNEAVIERELAWLEASIKQRIEGHLSAGAQDKAVLPDPPAIAAGGGPYADLVHRLGLDRNERLLLALSLAPHIAPESLDLFLLQNASTGRRFSEFGGFAGQAHAGFLPSAETAVFLLSGADRRMRVASLGLVSPDHRLFREGVIMLDHRHPDEPSLSATLRASPASLHQLLRGQDYAPVTSTDFPASQIMTGLEWQDLVLDQQTRQQIRTVELWIRHATRLMKDPGLSRRLKPGFRCLFYGSPGTGKTLTASLLGKRYGLPVYRVDLSRVVSKWIGETEKNLATLFDQAANRNWILFFDEADALFGKRSEVRSANDRSANQQIAYLLQRVEDYPGLVILATNQHGHMDEAFMRRFQVSVRFPMPDVEARKRLWREAFSGQSFPLSPELDLDAVASRHELAGGAIMNVLHFACLMAVERDPPIINAADVMQGVRDELQKEGRYVAR